MTFKLLFTLLILSVASSAAAYIGPGAGISVLGSLLAVLGTIVLAIGAAYHLRLGLARQVPRAKRAPLQTP